MVIWRSSRIAIALTSAAALSLTATPAMARHWHSRDRGIDGGDVLAGVLIIGGIAAVAAAASKSSRDRRASEYRVPENEQRSSGYPSDDDYRNWRNDRDRNSRYGEPDADDSRDHRGGSDYRDGRDWRSAGSTDGAVDVCVEELEQSNRAVDTVDGVNRDADGWRVNGRLRDGRSFSCVAEADGGIRRLIVDGSAVL